MTEDSKGKPWTSTDVGRVIDAGRAIARIILDAFLPEAEDYDVKLAIYRGLPEIGRRQITQKVKENLMLDGDWDDVDDALFEGAVLLLEKIDAKQTSLNSDGDFGRQN